MPTTIGVRARRPSRPRFRAGRPGPPRCRGCRARRGPPAAEVANAEPGIEIRPFQHHDDAVGFTLREPFEVAEGIAEEPDLDLDSSPGANRRWS